MTDSERYIAWLANNVHQLASVSEPDGDFMIWQAAMRSTAKRCAELCNDISDAHLSSGRYVSVVADHACRAGGQADGASECMRAIRREFGLTEGDV